MARLWRAANREIAASSRVAGSPWSARARFTYEPIVRSGDVTAVAEFDPTSATPTATATERNSFRDRDARTSKLHSGPGMRVGEAYVIPLKRDRAGPKPA